MGEIYFNLFSSAIGIAGLINTLSWQMIKDASGGPAIYPQIVLTALLACPLICIIQIPKQKKEERPDFVFMDLFRGHRGFFLLALVVYVVSLNISGFVVATIIYLNVVVSVMIYFSEGSFKVDKRLFVRGICLVTVAYGVIWFFQFALRVTAPTGIFGI